jgi:hypothetical protein
MFVILGGWPEAAARDRFPVGVSVYARLSCRVGGVPGPGLSFLVDGMAGAWSGRCEGLQPGDRR